MLLSELSGHYFYLTDHLLHHPLVHLRLGQMLEHTHRMAIVRRSDDNRWHNRHFRHFVLTKCILYGWLCWAMTRLIVAGGYALAGIPFDQLPEPSIRIFLTKLITIRMGPESLLCGLVGGFAVYIDYAITVQWHPYVLELLHSMAVVNGKDFVSLNPKLFPPIVLDALHPMRTCTKLTHWLRTLWWCEKAKFAVPVMRHFENHSALIRVRYIVMTTVMDLVSVVVNLFLAMIFLTVWVMTMFILRSELYQYPSILVEGLLLVLVSWNAIRMTIFSIEVIADASLGFRWLFGRQFNHQLRLVVDRYRASRRNRFNLVRLLLTFDRMRREHNRISTVTRLTNRTTISRLMLVTLTMNLGANVMLVSWLVYLRLTVGETVVTLIVIASQICLSLSACYLSIIWVDSLYCSAPLVLNACLTLQLDERHHDDQRWNGVIVRAKIKLAAFYELVHARKRFHFTVGPLAKITRHSLFQFIFVYSSYLFYAFKFIKDSNRAKF